jgi:hypothetical protein
MSYDLRIRSNMSNMPTPDDTGEAHSAYPFRLEQNVLYIPFENRRFGKVLNALLTGASAFSVVILVAWGILDLVSGSGAARLVGIGLLVALALFMAYELLSRVTHSEIDFNNGVITQRHAYPPLFPASQYQLSDYSIVHTTTNQGGGETTVGVSLMLSGRNGALKIASLSSLQSDGDYLSATAELRGIFMEKCSFRDLGAI